MRVRLITPPMSSRRRVPKQIPEPLSVPLGVTSGLLLGLGHVPFPLAWLAILPLAVVLYVVARERTPRLAARAAFWAGLAFWTTHLFWLPQSFNQDFGPIVWSFMPFIWLIEAGFWAITAYLAALAVGPTARPATRLAAFTLGLLVLDYLRGLGPFAFPWGNFGYLLLNTPLAQAAALGGVHLLAAIALALAAGAAALAWLDTRALKATAVVVLAALAYAALRPATPPATVAVRLVQGNIDPLHRALATGLNDLLTYQRLSGPASGRLVIWPEAAVLLPDALGARLPNLLSGVADYSRGPRANVVAAINNGRLLGETSKGHLVPFGEFFPARRALAFIYDPIFASMGLPGYASAEPDPLRHVLPVPGASVGAYVCYDSVFPDIARAYANNGADVLVNVSNDGWFGATPGVEQHFQMGRLRAIEQDRFVLRAGNTGITAVIDPRGHVVSRLAPRVPGVLDGRFAPIRTRTLYARLGDWPAWLAALALVILVVWARRSPRILTT